MISVTEAEVKAAAAAILTFVPAPNLGDGDRAMALAAVALLAASRQRSAERAASRRVTINGQPWTLCGDTASYEDVVASLGDHGTDRTVTWYARGEGTGGTLTPGQRVPLTDGLVFNAVVTGSA